MKRIKTMEELSIEVGVSRPTLSKYFADPTSVRDSMRKRIELGLSQVDYVPNFFARNMNRKSTRLIGVVIPHVNDLFYMKLLQEIEIRAEELDYSIIIQSSHDNPAKELEAIENFRSMNADGIIVAPIGSDEYTPKIKRLHGKIPIVFVDARWPKLEEFFPFIGSNNQQSISLMVDYLCNYGSPPVFLGMPLVNSNSLEREQAYMSRMNELGYESKLLTLEWSGEDCDFEDYAYQLMRQKFSQNEFLDATILCANDRLALGVLRAANELKLFANLSVNSNVFRVAGHDNHPLSGYVWPSLTTVTQDINQIARTAVDCIIDLSQNKERIANTVEEYLFNVELKLRESA